ncbi:hypothetical protein HY492_03905 [Candidatus Woesearchaeota archaeon]|nr:hypothetical protein [Candidatus Woesearchaeota archaeon]
MTFITEAWEVHYDRSLINALKGYGFRLSCENKNDGVEYTDTFAGGKGKIHQVIPPHGTPIIILLAGNAKAVAGEHKKLEDALKTTFRRGSQKNRRDAEAYGSRMLEERFAELEKSRAVLDPVPF